MPSDDPPPTVDTTPSGGPLGSPPDGKAPTEEADTRSESASEMPVPFDRVKAACQTFTSEWEPGGRADLPSYLLKVASDDQATLLRNLLEYEIHKRREHGESPRAEDYLAQLPDHTAVIRQAFLETSRLGLTVDQLPATEELPREQLPASRLGEFRLVRELGRGGMGSVFEAVHMQRGHRVALKTLPAVTPETLHRFKREFRLAAELTHPNLVSLHTLESDGGQYFITMDLVAGVDFRSWARPENILDEQRLRSAWPQLVAAVMALHAQGVVHRDLKPHNVLVTPDGRVVVLDFGLVAELAGATASLGKIAGTPTYMAPEQAAGQSVGPPADWYAVGVMLYEALAGRLPFQSTNVWEVLRQKQERDAPPLPDDSTSPAELADLCMKLLARAPADRADPLEIAGVVQMPMAANLQRGSSPDVLIGRETHLAALAEANDTLKQTGQPVTVFISGRSGEGKTSLAERFLAPIRQSSTVVLSGRCYDRESVPFKALDTLIGALTDHLRSLPSNRAAQLLPDDIGILARLFPELNRCEEIATAPSQRMDSIDQQQFRARAFGALRLLLDRISQNSPVIAFIDDLQWGDEDSARALFEVLRPPNAPTILLLGSFRSDEADDSPFLKEWQELQRVNATHLDEREVAVGPLSLEQSTTLVVNQLELDNDTVRRRALQFHAQTGGNPFLLTELVGCFDPESDAFHATDIHGVLDQKLATLPVEARPLLEAVSVSGQALNLDEAVAAAELASSCDDTLIAMRNSRLLRMVGSKVDTYHDRIRYAIVDTLESTARREMHARLASVIETTAGGLSEKEIDTLATQGQVNEPKLLSRAYDLAYHWDAAGDGPRALAYGLAAAVQARGQFALDVAVEQYALAWRNALESPQEVRLRISRGRGEALLQLGRYEESSGELAKSAELAEESFDICDVKGLQGELAFKLGKLSESMELIEDSLRGLGVRVPRSDLGFLRDSVKQGTIHLLHRCTPWLLHRRANDTSANLANHLLARLEYDYYGNNLIRLFWGSLVGLNRAERLPPSPSLSFQYVCHANDMAVIGWHRRAERYYNAAIDLSEKLNDQWGAALALNHFGLGCMGAARYEEAINKATPGKKAFAKLGDACEVHMASSFIGISHYGLGNVSEAIAEAQWLFQSCVRQGDNLFSPLALSLWSRATQGGLPLEELVGCVEVLDGSTVGTSALAMAEGYWHLSQGRTKEAAESFEQSWEACRNNVYLTPFNAWALVEFVTALRLHAEALEKQGSSDAEQRRQRWAKLARWANRLSWFVPQTRSHALRELSLAYAEKGKITKAWKTARKSCQVAGQQKAKLERAKSLLLQGRLAKRLGRKEADEQIQEAEQALNLIARNVEETQNSMQRPHAAAPH